MNVDVSRVAVAEAMTELRRALAQEASDLLIALEGTDNSALGLCPDVHATVHRLAGGLGFFGLQELGAAAHDLDLRMSNTCDDWTLSEVVELLSTIERSLGR